MTKLRRNTGYTLLVLGGVSTFVFLSPIFPIGIEAFFVGGVFFAFGIWTLFGQDLRAFFRRNSRTYRAKPHIPIDPLLPVRILKLAKERSGTLSVSDVAIALNVPLDQAEEGLNACIRSGNATVDFDIPQGYALYRFMEFLPPEERTLDT